MSKNTFLNALELLTAFSGDRAKKFEQFFQFSNDNKIVDVQIYAVGTEDTSVQYSSKWGVWKQTNNILRIKTKDGYEGVSGVTSNNEGKFTDKHLLELESIASVLLDLESLDPLEVQKIIKTHRPNLSDESLSSIDIALWDLAARKASIPLYKLLGGERDSIQAYASLPFYDSLPAYIKAVNDYSKLGLLTFKFHAWGLIEEDSKLINLIQKEFAETRYKFMLDLEGEYDFDEALKLGQIMDENLFIWLEAPIDESLLEQYRDLRSRIKIPITADGFNMYSSDFIKQGIEIGSWDAGRFDATTIGGISKALELLIISNDANLPIEIQSWGHSLAQATNLHLIFANERTRYFEIPMPKEAYEFGMKNGILFKDGEVYATMDHGLGINVDWDKLSTADYYIKTRG
ncbi:MAG: hypothetical protein CMD96_01775 [Gammaproteobacteria bacterium]|nr:hypothetical protein [Gammaproteobacteria bacterium]